MATWVASEKDRARIVIPAGTPVVPDPRPGRDGWILDPVPAGLFKTEEEEDFWRKVRTDPGQTFAGLKHRFRALELRLRAMEAHVTSREYQMDQELRGNGGPRR